MARAAARNVRANREAWAGWRTAVSSPPPKTATCLYALDEASGTPLWTAPIGGRITTLVAIVGNTVYATSEGRSVRALDAATGQERWRVDVIGAPTLAAVVDGRVFVGTDLGRVIAIGGAVATPEGR